MIGFLKSSVAANFSEAFPPLELDEPDERLHRVADNLLDHFGPGFRPE